MLESFNRVSEFAVPIGILLVVFMLIVPLPPELLDALLAVNISVSVLTILISIFIKNPLEFAIFPTLLLVVTLFRLSLDVSATRMILLHGDKGLDPTTWEGTPIGAGQLIPAFGNFVVGGNLVVGIILFLILIVVQFIVITQGAERVAQVAARFSLDAMPGKQMAVDSELHSGNIDAETARTKRKAIEQESSFYGAMDGAGKFVKGDTIAAIVIMLINIVGGMVVGILQKGMPPAVAGTTFTLLTVGNGLITTLPSFLMSTAMGMVVTRAASEANLGRDVFKQFTGQPKALYLTSGMLTALAMLGIFVKHWPSMPFLLVAGGIGYMGYFFSNMTKTLEQKAPDAGPGGAAGAKAAGGGAPGGAPSGEPGATPAKKAESIITTMAVDPISIEVGRGLLSLVDPNQGAKLLDRVTSIRRQIAQELGLIVPGVRFRDNLQLRPNGYLIKIKDIEVAQGEVSLNQFLAIGPENKLQALKGTRTIDPTYGMPGVWIAPDQRGEAERLGCMLFDPISVIATQVTEVIRSYSGELLGRQEVQALVDNIKKTHPAVVKDVIPEVLTIGEVQKVLQNLVRERISIRDLVTIVETLADHSHMTKDPELLTEYVRQSLSRYICREYQNNQGVINVITLDPQIEQTIASSIQRSEFGSYLALDPAIGQGIIASVGEETKKLMDKGMQPIILCTPQVRPHLKKLVERPFPNVVILSYNEIAPKVNISSVGLISFMASEEIGVE